MRPKLKEAFDDAEITPGFDRRYRKTMGNSIERIVGYEGLRRTIDDASDKRIRECELFQRLSGIVGAIGAILVFGDLWDTNATAISLAGLAVFFLIVIAFLVVSDIYSARKDARVAREEFLRRAGDEDRGIAPFEIREED